MWVLKTDSVNSVMVYLNMDQSCLRQSLMWLGMIPSNSMVTIMLKSRQFIMVILLNVMYVIIPSIRNSLKK